LKPQSQQANQQRLILSGADITDQRQFSSESAKVTAATPKETDMSDHTQLAIGRTSLSVPRLTKRALQVVLATVMTAVISLLIVLINNMLTSKGGWSQGLDVWLGFIRRSDILGTIVLTAVVTVGSIYWQRGRERQR
jgi:hypothetical protein